MANLTKSKSAINLTSMYCTIPEFDKNRYMCKYCKYSTYRKSDMHKHANIHLKIKPFKCDYCGKSFSQSSHIRPHIYRFHTDITCRSCLLVFSNMKSFREHGCVKKIKKPRKKRKKSNNPGLIKRPRSALSLSEQDELNLILRLDNNLLYKYLQQWLKTNY